MATVKHIQHEGYVAEVSYVLDLVSSAAYRSMH